jgi:DNA-binding NtrC family response regulator
MRTNLSPAKISDPAETLLAVDDDATVRDAETQMLRLQIYTELEARGAAKALRLAREASAMLFFITA